MRVGFTGTRQGMTDAQRKTFDREVCAIPMTEFHHGDCVGADDDAANVLGEIRQSGDPGPPFKIISHPPINETLRAFNQHADEVLPAKHYMERNFAIVAATDVLIATPADATEQHCGGTWRTVRNARGKGRPIYIIWPNGNCTREKHHALHGS